MAEAVQPRHHVTSSKLRKSCDSCAATKVGCNKEKPKCARCAKHGQPCVYSAARRAGRTSGETQSRAKGKNTTVTTAPTSPTFATVPTLAYNPSPSTLPSAVAFSPSLDLGQLDEWSASAVHFLENPLDGDASNASLFDVGLEDFSDYSSSITNISYLFPGSSEANATPNSKTPMSSGRDSVVPFPNLEDAHVSITNEASQAGQPCHSEPSGQCLIRAHGLLARLSPDRLGCGNIGSDSGPSPELPDFESVIAKNERTSEGIRTILQCSCSNDSYVLVTLSLVLFKIIAWCTAAACAASGEGRFPGASVSAEGSSPYHSPELVLQKTSMNQRENNCEGEDQQRIDLQLILSKLAGVQVLVDQLSQRLPNILNKPNLNQAVDSPIEIAKAPNLQAGGTSSMGPFSAELAHTLEADLRKRLVELSQTIIERLRRV